MLALADRQAVTDDRVYRSIDVCHVLSVWFRDLSAQKGRSMLKSMLAFALLSLALVAPLAHAGGTEDSSISVEGGDATKNGILIFGNVFSSKKCQKARTVELYNRGKDGSVLNVIDTDTTSSRGAWSVILRKSDKAFNLYVRVIKSQAGSTKCGAAKAIVIL